MSPDSRVCEVCDGASGEHLVKKYAMYEKLKEIRKEEKREHERWET